eukprot:27645-Prymnesium_polylepis.1
MSSAAPPLDAMVARPRPSHCALCGIHPAVLDESNSRSFALQITSGRNSEFTPTVLDRSRVAPPMTAPEDINLEFR